MMKLRFNFLKLSQLESLLAGDIKESEIQVYFLFDCSYEFRNMLCFLCPSWWSIETYLQVAIAEVPTIILRCISRDEAALAVAQKVRFGLFWFFFVLFFVVVWGHNQMISKMGILSLFFCFIVGFQGFVWKRIKQCTCQCSPWYPGCHPWCQQACC